MRIPRVGRRVVIPGPHFENVGGFEKDGLDIGVPVLPVEVPVVDIDHRRLPAVGGYLVHADLSSEQVHVRQHGDDFHGKEALAQAAQNRIENQVPRVLKGQLGGHLVVFRPGRDFELAVQNRQYQDILLGRLFREVQADAGAVAFLLPVGVVVDLDRDARARPQIVPRTLGQDLGAVTGHPAALYIRFHPLDPIEFEPRITEALVSRRRTAGRGFESRRLAGRIPEQDEMMDDAAVAGPHLDFRDAFDCFRRNGNAEAAVVVFHVRIGRVLRKLQDQIRIAESPFLIEDQRLRQVGRIALRDTRIHPARDQVDLGFVQEAFSDEFAVSRDRFPRRHIAGGRRPLDPPRPGPGGFVVHQ